MTYVKDVFGNDMFKDLGKFYVGFDDHVNRLNQIATDVAKTARNYPPYNIKKTGENSYCVEMAVAGFGQSDINIELEGDKLVISGAVATSEEDEQNYMFKGIANSAFTRTFTVLDNLEVKNAQLINGMLKIFLEGQHQLAKKIKIDVK